MSKAAGDEYGIIAQLIGREVMGRKVTVRPSAVNLKFLSVHAA
jgi:hypothetical protein